MHRFVRANWKARFVYCLFEQPLRSYVNRSASEDEE